MNKLLYIFLLGSIGCEGIVGGDGYIYSNDTKQPLPNVQVKVYLNDKLHRTTYSDSIGYFRGSTFVGCVPSCPSVRLEFTKTGFETQILDFTLEDERVRSMRRDSFIILLKASK